MFQEMIDGMEGLEKIDFEDFFIFQYLDGFFYYSAIDLDLRYKNIDYFRECLIDMVMESGMGTMFLIPEEEGEENNDFIIDIDDLDVNDRINV